MPSQLALHLLGPPHLHLNHEPVSTARRKALALLAYLAVHGQRQTRDSLSALLWPDYEQSRAFTNLRHTLWEVQQAIGEGWLTADREMIGLNPDAAISVDMRQFESLLTQSRAQENASLRIPLLADSVKLYRNHFLTGFSLKDAPAFNEWAFAKSEELRHQLAGALTLLSEDLCATGQAELAIPHARRLVALDPLNESSHRQLMQVYIQAGQHSAALKQYQTCEQILRKELNIDPQPETRELYKKIRKGDVKPVPVERRTEVIVPRHNLPHQLSTFIGREREKSEIADLVAKKRLVTLVGAGGIGKTSLSLQVGRNLLQDFPNGVWFIALDSLHDPGLTAQTVAAVLDIREDADRPLLEKLTDVLRTKSALLVFDNCEHLLSTCAQLITALLTACPNLKVLATSREALGVAGEAIYIMPSLPLPEPGIDSVGRLTEFESVRLFADRAALALTSFQLTKENIQSVVDICRKVDGIPLAIELAAARVNILQVTEIFDQLQESMALLTSDIRTILPRHQTLRASMDWSWGLLGAAEQTFLRQLSVFAGGWTLDAATAVCDGDVLELSSALVKKSLIVVDQRTGRGTRYRFHEMVREYVHEKLMASGEDARIRTRHLGYFVSLSEQAELGLKSAELVNWRECLDDERDNIRAALHWADKTDLEAGLCIVGSLRRYWESFNLHESIHWLERFLSNPESEKFPSARAQALHTYGWLLTWLQQFGKARAVTEESLTLFRRIGSREGEADTLMSLGNIKQFQDDLDAANELLQQSLKLAESLNDPWRKANAYYFLGWDRRDFRRSMNYWEKALGLYRSVGDQTSLANLLSALGQFLVLDGDMELGETYLDEAMLLWQSNKSANIWENARIAKSVIALTQGEAEQAYALLEEALVASRETGNKMSYLWVRVRLGYAALRADKLEEAQDIFIETARGFQTDGYTIGTVFALEGMAALYAETGSSQLAARLIGMADRTRAKVNDPRPLLEQVDVDKTIDACLIKMGEAAFSDAYDTGTEMTLEEAVVLVQKELVPFLVPRPHRKTDRAKRQPGYRSAPRKKIQKEG